MKYTNSRDEDELIGPLFSMSDFDGLKVESFCDIMREMSTVINLMVRAKAGHPEKFLELLRKKEWTFTTYDQRFGWYIPHEDLLPEKHSLWKTNPKGIESVIYSAVAETVDQARCKILKTMAEDMKLLDAKAFAESDFWVEEAETFAPDYRTPEQVLEDFFTS